MHAQFTLRTYTRALISKSSLERENMQKQYHGFLYICAHVRRKNQQTPTERKIKKDPTKTNSKAHENLTPKNFNPQRQSTPARDRAL
jgi:hypothetical protein